MTKDTPPGAMEMTEDREIDCEFCGGDGGGEVVIGHDPSGPITSFERCLTCHGTGIQTVVVEPITMEDLDDER